MRLRVYGLGPRSRVQGFGATVLKLTEYNYPFATATHYKTDCHKTTKTKVTLHIKSKIDKWSILHVFSPCAKKTVVMQRDFCLLNLDLRSAQSDLFMLRPRAHLDLSPRAKRQFFHAKRRRRSRIAPRFMTFKCRCPVKISAESRAYSEVHGMLYGAYTKEPE